ncbi:MAG: serine hydrolase domain-containing protein [Candidatus Odinarchaeota archaeon]
MRTNQKAVILVLFLLFLVIAATFFLDGTLLTFSRQNGATELKENLEPLSNRFSGNYWPTSTPEEQGLNPDILSNMSVHIDSYMRNLDSVLIIRNGVLVYEEYYHLYTRTSKHEIYSCTKSITSALIGIAIDKGYIDNVNQKVVDFFPDKTFTNLDSRKQNMTLEHLLTMTTGLDWGESSPPPGYGVVGQDYYHMITSSDWVQYVLDKPVIHEPGEVFNYNSGASHVLSAIIQKTTGMETLSFAREYLFGPLGIEPADITWNSDPQGIATGGSALRMIPQDMAKLGYLFLNNGTWDDKQVVPTEWVETATRGHPPLAGSDYYGYQWWLETISQDKDINGYHALGYNGQMIFVLPELDMVVVFTSGSGYPVNLLRDYIIPATAKYYDDSEPDSSPHGTASFSFHYNALLLLVLVHMARRKLQERWKSDK